MYKSKDLSRTCRVSRKQIKHYISLGLLPKYCLDQKGWISMNDNQVFILFKIRILQKMGFKLNQIKLFFDNNLKDKVLQKMIKNYISERTETLKVFQKNFNNFFPQVDKIYNRDNFAIFTHNNIADFVTYKLYELRKTWYLDEDKKNFLRTTRKRMFESMKNYTITFHEEYQNTLNKYFKKFNDFFRWQNIDISPLVIISYFQWLTYSSRYKTEFLKLAEGSYMTEMYEMLLVWVAKYY